MSAGSLNFTELAGEGRFTARRAGFVLVLGLLVLFDGLDTQMLGLIAHGIMGDLGLPISTFGVVFSTGLLGGLVGSLVMSPVADRVLGPKRLTIAAMTLAALATMATPAVGTLAQLLAIRFIAGLGLGSAMPGIFALAAEYSPKRSSRQVTACLIASMPLGSLLGGLIGRAIVPAYGWEMLLYAGGLLTLLLTTIAAVLLPESVQFLLTVRRDGSRAGRAARRLFGNLGFATFRVDGVDDAAIARQPIARLFSPEFRSFTVLIWLGCILSQGIIYFVLGWTPALLEKTGSTTSLGMNAASMFGLGGAIGTLAQGWLATRFNIYRVMLLEMALYVVAVLSLPLILDDATLAPLMVFLMSAGACAYQTGYVLILIEAYPSDVRSTGFGWSFGVGRIGATSVPVLIGFLVGWGWAPRDIFVAAALPGVGSALALAGVAMLLRRRSRTASLAPAASAPNPA